VTTPYPSQPQEPQPTQQFAPPAPVTAQPKQRRSVPLIATVAIAVGAALVACFAGVGVGAAGKTANKASALPTPNASTVTIVRTVQAPAPAASTVTVTVAPPPPPGPATVLSRDGTYLVGSDIAPGTYRAKDIGNNCYWARLNSTNPQDIITNDNVSAGGQALVTIAKGDKAFQTQGCGTWQKVG
jgi:hypothetical protein